MLVKEIQDKIYEYLNLFELEKKKIIHQLNMISVWRNHIMYNCKNNFAFQRLINFVLPAFIYTHKSGVITLYSKDLFIALTIFPPESNAFFSNQYSKITLV
jgi:hypothetical protein